MWCAFVSRRCHYLRYYAQIVETPKRLPNVELPKKRLTQDFKPLLTFDEHKQEKLKKVESQEQIESKKNDINLSNKLHELILHILPQDVTGMEARKVLHAHIKRHVTPLPDTIAKMIDRARPAKNKIKDQQDFVSKFTRHVKKRR
ncbi:hypothetical protein AKO1_004530 [Acrasis kona]|uniref:Uncharacterized protein n=1 Tax=Acrasis kona TaxID=1008807 RepID=A0AAW2Z467_9EUKA